MSIDSNSYCNFSKKTYFFWIGWFCFVMSLSMPYVCIVSLRVFACISTWALVY